MTWPQIGTRRWILGFFNELQLLRLWSSNPRREEKSNAAHSGSGHQGRIPIALSLGLGRAAVASEVTTPVEQLHAGLMAIMKAGKAAPFQQRYDMIAPVIGRTFDLEVILRQVIGPRLAALPPDQRAAVGDAFRRYTIASYVANFDTYSGQRFEVAPGVRAAGSDRVVETQIAAASGQGHVLDYVMRQESGGWKVVDVLVDDAISRVVAQRSEMRSMLADSGGAGLLVGLRQKTADLSGGILQ